MVSFFYKTDVSLSFEMAWLSIETSCCKFTQLFFLYFSSSFSPFRNEAIRMSRWSHTMVDGAKFWISCRRLKTLTKAIQSLINDSKFSAIYHYIIVTSECKDFLKVWINLTNFLINVKWFFASSLLHMYSVWQNFIPP